MKIIALCLAGILLISFSLKKNYEPPGTVQLYRNLYFDKSSITVADWLDYMVWLKKEYGADSEEYNKSKVDKKFVGIFYSERDHAIVWVENLGKTSEMSYISKKQAEDYCRWRTDRVNESIFIDIEKIEIEDFKKNRDQYLIPDYVKYRLPYLSEWEHVAEIGYSIREIKLQEKRYQEHAEKKNRKYSKYCFSSGIKNKKGISGINGGVSEFINEIDSLTIGMGCTYREINIEGHVVNTRKNKGPNSYTGFRCVAEVLVDF